MERINDFMPEERRMEILSVLEALEDLIDSGVSVPFTGKCVVNRDEILILSKIFV